MNHSLKFLALLTLFVTEVTRASSFGQIILGPPLNKTEDCAGGNLNQIVKIETLPGGQDVTKGFKLQKVPAGLYRIHYTYKNFEKLESGCYEFGSVDIEKNRKQFDLKVESGWVYQLNIGENFEMVIDIFDKIPITQEFVQQFLRMTHSMQMWRDLCSGLFDKQASKYHSQFEASSIQTYVKSFELEKSFSDIIIPTMSEEEKLSIIGQSKAHADKWCNEQFTIAIGDFDEKYAGREKDIIKFMLSSRN